MSRFKVKVSLDNVTRTVEFERQKYDLLALRERTAKAFNVPNVNIRYTSSTNESFYITNDAQLQKAIKDVEKSGVKNLEVKVFKDTSGSASAPASSSVRSIPQTAPSTVTPAKTVSIPAPTPVIAPATTSSSLLSFRLEGNPSSSDERVVVKPETFQDYFLISVQPGKYDTDIEVTLTGSTLCFLTVHSLLEGTLTKIMRGTQTLDLNTPPKKVEIIGQQLKVFYR